MLIARAAADRGAAGGGVPAAAVQGALDALIRARPPVQRAGRHLEAHGGGGMALEVMLGRGFATVWAACTTSQIGG
ncbi:MAG: hypothetical protein R3F65_14600 [bacterium]